MTFDENIRANLYIQKIYRFSIDRQNRLITNFKRQLITNNTYLTYALRCVISRECIIICKCIPFDTFLLGDYYKFISSERCTWW